MVQGSYRPSTRVLLEDQAFSISQQRNDELFLRNLPALKVRRKLSASSGRFRFSTSAPIQNSQRRLLQTPNSLRLHLKARIQSVVDVRNRIVRRETIWTTTRNVFILHATARRRKAKSIAAPTVTMQEHCLSSPAIVDTWAAPKKWLKQDKQEVPFSCRPDLQ